jgi:O-antigen/teichoic acid export membrane protein
MPELTQKIKQNTGYILLQNLITPLVNLVIGIYVIKKLTIADYGIYSLLYALIGYLTLFSSLGLLNVFQRYVPEYYQQKSYGKIKRLVHYGLGLRLLLAIVFFALMLWAGPLLDRLFRVDNFHHYIYIFSIGIILFLEIQLVEVTLSSLLLNRAIMISYFGATLIRGSLVYYFLEQHLALRGLLLAETIYYGILFLQQLLFYRSQFSSQHPSSAPSLPVKRLVRYGGLSYFDEIGWTILDVKTDFFVISSFLGPTLVGFYSFANQFMESISRVLPFKMLRPLIRSVFFAKFSEKGQPEQVNRHFNFLVKIIAFMCFPIFLAVLAVGDKVILHLFDAKYLPALRLLYIFTGFMMIISFQFPLQLIVQAMEKVEINFYSNIFSIYNLVGDLLIVKLLGLTGVALVTCSARLFQLAFVWFRIKKLVALQVEVGPLVRITINSCLMMAFLLMVRPLIQNLISLIVALVLGWALYFGCSFFNKSFFSEERKFINQLLPRPVFVF